MEGASVLVTGGAGFIGSNLANHLAADNEVIALDDGYLGTPENLDPPVEYPSEASPRRTSPPTSTSSSTSPRCPRMRCTRTTPRRVLA